MDLEHCFQTTLSVPVTIIDVVGDGQTLRTHNINDEAALDQLLAPDNEQWDYECRLISICQRNSHVPLQITRAMLNMIVKAHSISEFFWELPSCFYERDLNLEETYCIPVTQKWTSSSHEAMYTIRYPEYKRSREWTIRQTGVYQKNCLEGSKKTLYIIFNPTPSSKFQTHAKQRMNENVRQISADPFWLHSTLFETYFPSWRRYSLSIEQELLPIVNKTWGSYIDEVLPVNHETLSKFADLRNRFLQIPTILAQSAETLRELTTLAQSMVPASPTPTHVMQFPLLAGNYRRQCAALTRTSSYLQQRAEVMSGFLSGTLSLRDQVIAKQQNNSMVRLNKSAVFITALTLLYLPSSWLATFFGMNFFAMDQNNRALIVSPMTWIYALSALLLTAGTMTFYFVLIKHEGRFFSGLSPNSQSFDRFAGLRRRFTWNKTTGNSEEAKTTMV